MALNGLICADVPLSNYSLTHYEQMVVFVNVSSDNNVTSCESS